MLETRTLPDLPKITPNNISFSPDGKLLATGEENGTIYLWDLSSNQKKQFSYDGPLYSIAFSPDGKYLAATGYMDKVLVWNLQDDETHKPQELTKCGERNRGISFSPLNGEDINGGKYLAIASDWGIGCVWDWKNKEKPIKKLIGHTYVVRSISFSPDGKWLATGGGDNTARLWKWNPSSRGKEIKESLLLKHQGYITSVNFSPDGKYLATAGVEGITHLWNLKDEQEQKAGSNINQEFKFDSFNYLEGLPWLSNGYGFLYKDILSNFFTDRTPSEIDDTSSKDSYQSFSFSPDGKQLAISSFPSKVIVKDLQSNHSEDMVCPMTTKQDDTILSLKFSSSLSKRKLLAMGTNFGIACVWDLESHKRWEIPTDNSSQRIWSVSFSNDGKLLATGGEDLIVRVWDWENKKVLAKLYGNKDVVLSISFSNKDKLLATVGKDKTARVWEWISQEQLAEFKEHEDNLPLTHVKFSSDDKQLVAAGSNGTELWKIESMDKLTEGGCDWVRDYLENNPNAGRDRHLCDGL